MQKGSLFNIRVIDNNINTLGLFIWGLGFPIDIFANGYIEIPLITHCVMKLPVKVHHYREWLIIFKN